MLVRAVERALESAGVRRTGAAPVLVACSGGPDSMALLRATATLLGAHRAVAGHVDHAVSPGSAAVAEALSAFCAHMGHPFRMERLEPPSADEATLRSLRYAALERLRAATGSALILVGHTLDDQAETILLGLLRSGRLRSLEGMSEVNGRVVRPLLSVPRARVHAYVAAKGWPSWEDPTNREPAYLRNRIRKELLPLLERRYAPGIARRLVGLGDELRSRGGGLAETSGRALGGASHTVPSDRAASDRAAPDRVASDRSPSHRVLSDRALSERAPSDRDSARREPFDGERPVGARSAGEPSGAPNLAGAAQDPPAHDEAAAWRARLARGIRVERVTWRGPLPNEGGASAAFDARDVPTFRIRTFQTGDRVRPFGTLRGRRRVSDVLGEAGVPVELRNRWPVVVDAEDGILWVAGLLRSKSAQIREDTQTAWVFTFEEG